MKKLLFILCLVLAFNSYSQTRTKKYNSLQKRYEYFENGKMVGYEKYNSLREQWEYYSTESSQSSNNYGEPQSMFNAELASKVLAKRQRDYDNRKSTIDKNIARLSELKKEIAEHAYDIENNEKRNQLIELYNIRYENYFDKYYDVNSFKNTMESFDLTTAMLNGIITIYNSTYKEVMYRPENKKSTTASTKSYSNYTQVKESAISINLRKNPSVNSSVIYELKGGERVKILERTEGVYYKVKVDNHIGYISKGYLEL